MGKKVYIGNHGTDSGCVENILNNNFKISTGLNHWYGEGVYFFINDINVSTISELATQWAIDQAYDKNTKIYKYKEYAVLEARICIEESNICDLRCSVSLKLINEVREKIKSDLKGQAKKMSDNEIWRFLRTKFDIEMFISHTYIKFGQDRRCGIYSRVPNCTIVSLQNPNKNIDKNEIKLICKGGF